MWFRFNGVEALSTTKRSNYDRLTLLLRIQCQSDLFDELVSIQTNGEQEKGEKRAATIYSVLSFSRHGSLQVTASIEEAFETAVAASPRSGSRCRGSLGKSHNNKVVLMRETQQLA